LIPDMGKTGAPLGRVFIERGFQRAKPLAAEASPSFRPRRPFSYSPSFGFSCEIEGCVMSWAAPGDL